MPLLKNSTSRRAPCANISTTCTLFSTFRQLATKRLVLPLLLFSTVTLICGPVSAQAATRPVSVTWSAANPAPTIGYNLYRCAAPCTPVAAGNTPLNSSPQTGLTYTDNPTTGVSYIYGADAVSAACTPTTPPTTACGTSTMSVSGTVPVPPTPNPPGTIIVVVP